MEPERRTHQRAGSAGRTRVHLPGRTRVHLPGRTRTGSRHVRASLQLAGPLLLLLLLAGCQRSAQLQPEPQSTGAASSGVTALRRGFRTSQVSACDGQPLAARCADDYVIDVIGVRSTLLAADQVAQFCQPAANNRTGSDLARDGAGRVCGQPAPGAPSQVDELLVTNATRHECKLRNSCLLDLAAVGAPGAPGDAARHLARVCPQQRKLLELTFKCLPGKLNRRFVCRGQNLQLECEANRKLVVGAADYGAHRDEQRAHERCQSAPVDWPLATPFCYANISQVMGAVQTACNLRSRCELAVGPELLGATGCPSAQVEYLRVMYSCVAEHVLAPRTTEPPEEAPSLVHAVAATPPREPAGRTAGAWSALERARFVAARYPLELSALCLLASALVLAGLAVRACRARGPPTRPAKGRAAGSSSSSSSSAAGSLDEAKARAEPTRGSCGESLFSLDELATTAGSSDLLRPDECDHPAAGRPRYWSFYGHHDHARPPTLGRTFGPPQVPHFRSGLCAAHAQAPLPPAAELLAQRGAEPQHFWPSGAVDEPTLRLLLERAPTGL